MRRPRVLAVLAVLAAAALAGCGSKKSDDSSKQPPATGQATTTPAATTTTPATPPAAGAAELKLPLAERKPGVRWTKSDEVTSEINVGAGDKKLTIHNSRKRVDQHEALEVDEVGALTRVKVTYVERKESERSGDKARDKPSPLVGKSYVVWSKEGTIDATRDDGSPVSAEELAELAEDQDELGKPQVMQQILAGRTWKIGETYTFTADDISRLAEGKGPRAPKLLGSTLTLRTLEGNRAVFTMTNAMQLPGKMDVKFDMTGTVALDTRSGLPLLVELAGPITGTAGGNPVTGTMSGKTSYEYAAP